MKTFTGKTKVWLSSDWTNIDDLLALTDDEAVNYVAYASHDMSGTGWRLIGTATVTIELNSKEAIHKTELDALNKELAEVRTMALLAENTILHRISKLQALTFNGSEISEVAA